MIKNKKWLLLLIVLFPSAFWLILETGTINSRKLPHHGPKSFNGKDTSFYSLGDLQFPTITNSSIELKLFDTTNYPILALAFIKEKYISENYRLEGLIDYASHQKEDIDIIPLLIVYPKQDTVKDEAFNLKDSLHIKLKNIEQCFFTPSKFDSINYTYFKEKPIYIDYSFIVLIDKQRNIRGYYDGRYTAEIKRLLQEYKHLRLKEEKKQMIKENEIKNENKK